MKRMFLVAVLLLSITHFSIAQVETHYFEKGEKKMNVKRSMHVNQEVIQMPAFDVDKLIEEDARNKDENKIFRFGKGFDVSYSLADGYWEKTDGGRLWTMCFSSKGALSLNFVFEDFYLPEGAELYIENQDGTVVFGPVTSKAIHEDGFFLTDIIPGEQVSIYLYEPSESMGLSKLTIKRVVHGYKDCETVLESAESPQNYRTTYENVACYSAYMNSSNGVALVMRSNGTEVCSGSLVISTERSFKGYFLTTYALADTNSDNSLSNSEITAVQQCSFKFLYRASTCTGNASGGITYSHAAYRASWNNTRFLLLEIGNNINSNSNLTWLGWDRSGNNPISGACISHPNLDGLKIAFDTDYIYTSFIPGYGYTQNSWIVYYDIGGRNTGTPGAPLLDQNKRVVGQETWESSNQTLLSYFGKLSLAWNGGNTSATRLKDWLDPLNTNWQTFESDSPLANVSIVGNSVITNSGTFSVSNLPSGYTVNWKLSDNYYNQNCLFENNPSANECTITTNNNHSMMEATLTATIMSGLTLVQTLTKTVYADVFAGTYYNGVTTKQVNLPYPLYVKRNANISLNSQNLVGATLTHEGSATMSQFSHNSSSGTLNLYFTSLGTRVVHVSCTNGLNYHLPFIVTDNTNQLNVVIGDGQIEVTLVPVGEEELRELGYDVLADMMIKSAPQTWTLEVYNATTGEKVFNQEVDGTNYTIDTTGWKPGVYVVRAVIGDEVLNEKVIVK